ncbi:hypothetical protein PDE_06588 [Penicillium oxalicum 114-2]|uniref:Uncharacterized protein n=1 Tax=Penicillium oxalicum (strain 114-2 / CGMCC 5302) TaxID=933388 RepID=S8AYX8_PENO1|nr:hypothetical protein PDE_06588 [Penicillium oxalicum 114-2]
MDFTPSIVPALEVRKNMVNRLKYISTYHRRPPCPDWKIKIQIDRVPPPSEESTLPLNHNYRRNLEVRQ